jgi:glutamate/tyrosine decarboxylase-like PLP-dependent enzyme
MQFNENIDIWNKVTELLSEYFQQNKNIDTHVVEYKTASELKTLVDLNLEENPRGVASLVDDIKTYLKLSVRTSHPHFNNQLQAGANFESLLGELISFVSNTTMATFEVAPVATIIESILIKEINKTLGYDDGGGVMLTGGSNANLLALHCARNSYLPEVKYKGNQGQDLCVFVSEEAHYSFKKAVMLVGIGLDNLILNEADNAGRMLVQDLESKILKAKNAGKRPLMIASTFGTTVKGAFDPIEDNQKIADKYGMWHHIDGAWGGAAMFSGTLKHHLSSAKNADSFTFDAHKVLGTGIITSFLLTKREGVILAANSGGGSEYLFHQYENAEYDTGKGSLQCGRKVDALKLWFTWRSLGTSGLRKFVENQYDKAMYLKEKLSINDRFKLLFDPKYLNICFQVIPKNKSLEINQHNLDLRFKLVKEGRFLVNFSSDKDGTTYFRYVLTNASTTMEDLDYFLDELLKLSEEF